MRSGRGNTARALQCCLCCSAAVEAAVGGAGTAAVPTGAGASAVPGGAAALPATFAEAFDATKAVQQRSKAKFAALRAAAPAKTRSVTVSPGAKEGSLTFEVTETIKVTPVADLLAAWKGPLKLAPIEDVFNDKLDLVVDTWPKLETLNDAMLTTLAKYRLLDWKNPEVTTAVSAFIANFAAVADAIAAMEKLAAGEESIKADVEALVAATKAQFDVGLAALLPRGTVTVGRSTRLAFDPAACRATDGTPLVISDGVMVTSQRDYSLAVCDTGFDAGVSEWSFKLVHDVNTDQGTCFGAVEKPIAGWRYDSSTTWVVAAFSGVLYGTGKVGTNRTRVCTGDTVKITWDAGEGALSYAVNGVDQGVTFRGLRGKKLYPAVAFYRSGCKVAIVQ